MAQATPKPNVPVFVSSTFTDMQVYRRKVQDALTQLEAIVRGMEQFGSKPGSPVEECVKVPAKDFDTGPGAEKLQALKEQLKKRHTVSFFTTPEDLQVRIMHDVPSQFAQMGVEVTDGLRTSEEIGDREVLKNFEILPKLFSGRQVTIEFPMGAIRSAFSEDCAALHLEHGATVACHVTIDSGQAFYIYGEREIALEMLSVPKGTRVKARANTAFGTYTQVLWADDGPIPETRGEPGLVITEILSSEPTNTQSGEREGVPRTPRK